MPTPSLTPTSTPFFLNFPAKIFEFSNITLCILSINFKVKASGTAPVVFSTGSILANDGKGTNILAGMNNASLILKAVIAPAVIETPKVITTVSGTFEISEIERNDLTDPVVSFKFNANYKSPGVDHYEIQIDNGVKKIWQANNTSTYQTGVLNYGTHTITVRAFDHNGNFLTDSATFTIKALNAPIITDYQSKISNRDNINIAGKTEYENAKVKILLAQGDNEPKDYKVESDHNGNFVYIILDKLTDGIYTLQAQVIDTRGAMSDLSDKLTINVSPTQLTQVSSQATFLLSVIIPLTALVFLFVFIIWYTWRKFRATHRKLNSKIIGVEHSIHKAFELLKEDVQDQVKMLEHARTKRQLTAEEDKIIKHFKEDLEDTERFIKKEIEGLEKEVE